VENHHEIHGASVTRDYGHLKNRNEVLEHAGKPIKSFLLKNGKNYLIDDETGHAGDIPLRNAIYENERPWLKYRMTRCDIHFMPYGFGDIYYDYIFYDKNDAIVHIHRLRVD
jgi:hypothetical protein